MIKPQGISKNDREKLTLVLRSVMHTITAKEASDVLGLPKEKATELLMHWAAKGWLSRIKRGVYIPVPLASLTSNISIEDPFIIAEKLYRPCYIGGWSAAEYWGLTEQIFRTTVVYTTQKMRNKRTVIKDTIFLLHKISVQSLFGLTSIWREQIKVSISDPSRTMIDVINNPTLGGGIRHVADMLLTYLKSEHRDLDLLIHYANELNNGAIFKRLGFLLELYDPMETKYISACKENLTAGKAKLDPSLENNKLNTRWQLWLPENWKQ